MGMNCMDCHKENGGGNGWFVVAGTVFYDSLQVTPYPGATVKLYTGPNGTDTLVHTIEVDTKGIFIPQKQLISAPVCILLSLVMLAPNA